MLTRFGALCLVNPYTSDGSDDGAVPILLAHQVNDLNRNVFNRTPVQPGLFGGLHKKKTIIKMFFSTNSAYLKIIGGGGRESVGYKIILDHTDFQCMDNRKKDFSKYLLLCSRVERNQTGLSKLFL